jgi:indolepyruvate ferredoxin oxidoreductase alpha subunit
MLKFTREQRRREGYALHQVDIDQEACERIHTCVSQFACPSFTLAGNGRVDVNPDLCIGDGSCRQTCPTRAIAKPRKV